MYAAARIQVPITLSSYASFRHLSRSVLFWVVGIEMPFDCDLCTSIDDVDAVLATMCECLFGLLEENNDVECLINCWRRMNSMSRSCKKVTLAHCHLQGMMQVKFWSGRV